MNSKIAKLLYVLWPPYEAYVAQKFIAERRFDDYAESMELLSKELSGLLLVNSDDEQRSVNLNKLEEIAVSILESETKRQETIESKALTFLFLLGLSTTLVSALPALFTSTWQLPLSVIVISGGSYIIAVIHFIVSVYFAIRVRQVVGLAVPNVAEFIDSVKNDSNIIFTNIVINIKRAKYNESILTLKANALSIAEKMFLRGLVFIVIATISSAGAKILVENGVSIPTW